MDKKMMLMRRTSLRTLGCVLMDISLPVEEALGEERSEEFPCQSKQFPLY